MFYLSNHHISDVRVSVLDALDELRTVAVFRIAADNYAHHVSVDAVSVIGIHIFKLCKPKRNTLVLISYNLVSNNRVCFLKGKFNLESRINYKAYSHSFNESHLESNNAYFSIPTPSVVNCIIRYENVLNPNLIYLSYYEDEHCMLK